MAWRTLTDTGIAVLTGTHITVERSDVGIVVGVVDDDRRREPVA